MNDRAVLIREAATTLAAVAAEVPASLQGFNYDLYLIRAQRDIGWQGGVYVEGWNKHPTYVFDEWTAYTNGTESMLRNRITDDAGTARFMLEFVPYSICVAKAAHDAAKSDDPQMKAFIQWQIVRCNTLARGKTRAAQHGRRGC